MDRTSLIGIILIALVVSVWVFFQSTVSERDVTPAKTQEVRQTTDSVRSVTEPKAPPIAFDEGQNRTVVVENDVMRLRFSSQGATIRSWVLKDYQPWYKEEQPEARVDLIKPWVHEFDFTFRATNGSKVEGRNVPFTWQHGADELTVSGSDSVVITAIARTEDGGQIERTYVVYGNRYGIRTVLTLDGMDGSIPRTNRYLNLEWKKGLRYQERSSVDESNNAVAIASYNGEIDELDATTYAVPEERSAAGKIDFLATRSKYFAVAMIPTGTFDGNVFYSGVRHGAPREGYYEEYSLVYRLPYNGGRQSHEVMLFGGPMQYDTLASYGLTEIMDFGFKWIVKPIGEYFMLPLLKFVHSFIPNWGIAIIIFALFLKVLFYPLSITQLKSARKMQLVAPLMNDIREKYKDDMKTQQQEMMKLYGEYGINPAGGCLPLLLQMPFLYALYAVLNLNIDLRQAAFLPVWITDLSVPDVVLSLPFKIPLFNIDKFSGLALFMGATLFIQQKQVVTDPRQKGLVYMMPVMLTLMFSTLPAGLNLYYFVFNIVGIGQQLYMTKFSKKKLTLEDLKKEPKKEGWLQRKMREAQDVAASQGRTLPGKPPANKGLTRGKNGRKPGRRK
jgi:YidC/Oxa1 family membrane protein insertase